MDLRSLVLERTGVEILRETHTNSTQQKWVRQGMETPEGKPIYYTMNVRAGLGVGFIHPNGRLISLGIHKKNNDEKLISYIDRLVAAIECVLNS